MKRYIPYAIILLIIFFAGRYSKSDKTPELEQKWKSERKLTLDQLQKKQVEITHLEALQKEIDRRRVEDSLKFASALERNQRAYNALKKKYNEINLNRATAHELDSVVSVLYGR